MSDSFSSELDQMLSAALKERMCACNLLREGFFFFLSAFKLIDSGDIDEQLFATSVCDGVTCIAVPAVLLFFFFWWLS